MIKGLWGEAKVLRQRRTITLLNVGEQSSLVVAIDGPSGSGKSSVARGVANALGLRFLDTGAMYRAVTWWLLEQGVDLDDRELVAQRGREIPLQMGTDPQHPTVHVGDIDVSATIRETRITTYVSKVATNLKVREFLVARQREYAIAGGIVIEGRDITTVVAPDADVRVLLTAHEDVRLQRRAQDVHGHADEDAVAATRDQIVRRDQDDSTVATFTEAADGVALVDSSQLSLDDTIEAVLKLARR